PPRLGVVGAAERRDGLLYRGPQVAGGQQVLVLHRLEQRFDVQVAEADAEERGHALRRQVDQVGPLAAGAQCLAQVGQRRLAVEGAAEGDGAGVAHALVPVVGQEQRWAVRHGVDVVGGRLLVIVRGADARRGGGAQGGGGVPQGRVAVEERAHVL